MTNQTWPGTGRLTRLAMFGLTEREIAGRGDLEYSLIDAIRSSSPDQLRMPSHRPDLVEYVDLALRSGFPVVALPEMPADMRAEWLDGYVAQLLTRDAQELEPGRDSLKLGRYLQAIAAHSATEIDHKKLYDAAGIDRRTATAYDALLDALFVVEQVQPWDDNQLKRLTATPKRYMIDPAMMAAVLGATTGAIVASGKLLGGIIDTFVMSQLRPEVAVRSGRTARRHLRTRNGREEIDVVLENADGSVLGIEVKATAAPTAADARHLAWLRDALSDRFVGGAVLHTGPDAFVLGERILAVPICAFWG